MRLFVAVWPSADVVGALEALPRPSVPRVRWTTPDQWHVTLVFLGEVPGDRLAPLEAALGSAAARAAVSPEATLGPATGRLGRAVLCAPVHGLEVLAAAARAALGATGTAGPEADRPFRGHCTLARTRGGRDIPASLVGTPIAARWLATELCLVRSSLDPGGARYETLATATVPS